MPITIDGTNGITTPAITGTNSSVSLTGSFTSVYDYDGVITSGTYTPVLFPSNWKYVLNGGAFTLAAPVSVGDNIAYSLVLYVENTTGAGAITTSGFSKVIGDSFTTTVGHIFYVYVTVFGGGAKIANIVAAQ